MKNKFPIVLFIVTSFVALVLFPIFFAFIKHSITPQDKSKGTVQQNKYFDNSTDDPLITKASTYKQKITKPVINNSDPIIGSKNALISIVQFSDFECSFCAKQEGVLKKIIEEYKDKIRIVWKDYPVRNPDSISYQSAIAAQCAFKQGKFWSYHDILYEKNSNLNQEAFLEIAEEVNLDLNNFKQCLKDNQIKELINSDIEEANSLDITGIPFTYINELGIMGEISFPELKQIIEFELKKLK